MICFLLKLPLCSHLCKKAHSLSFRSTHSLQAAKDGDEADGVLACSEDNSDGRTSDGCTSDGCTNCGCTNGGCTTMNQPNTSPNSCQDTILHTMSGAISSLARTMQNSWSTKDKGLHNQHLLHIRENQTFSKDPHSSPRLPTQVTPAAQRSVHPPLQALPEHSLNMSVQEQPAHMPGLPENSKFRFCTVKRPIGL